MRLKNKKMNYKKRPKKIQKIYKNNQIKILKN